LKTSSIDLIRKPISKLFKVFMKEKNLSRSGFVSVINYYESIQLVPFSCFGLL